MISDLVEASIHMVRSELEGEVGDAATERADARVLDALYPQPGASATDDERERNTRTRDKLLTMLRSGHLDERQVEVEQQRKETMALAMKHVRHASLHQQLGRDRENAAANAAAEAVKIARHEMAVKQMRERHRKQEARELLEEQRKRAVEEEIIRRTKAKQRKRDAEKKKRQQQRKKKQQQQEEEEDKASRTRHASVARPGGGATPTGRLAVSFSRAEAITACSGGQALQAVLASSSGAFDHLPPPGHPQILVSLLKEIILGSMMSPSNSNTIR